MRSSPSSGPPGRASPRYTNIDAGISPGLEAKIFTLMDSIATGQKEKAYKFLEDMLIMGESPVKILAMLIRKLENMACAKELLNMGF